MQSELAEKQVSAILKHQSIIDRVKLTLLSGLDNKIYDDFKSLIKSSVNTPIKELSFFYPTNTPKITDKLGLEDRKLMRDIYLKYAEATNSSIE